jgi:mxaC protein
MSEIVLHRFFQTLPTPYRAYQAQNAGRSGAGDTEVGKQQNFPLDFLEQIPRQAYGRHCLAFAAICCLLLLIYRSMQLRSWT